MRVKEEVLRNTQIRNMHEMGEIKRAQEQRIDEVSVQKFGENHETIQRLTSQVQQMQEQMNAMHDSGDFQDVESNCCGINPEYRKTFLEINFLYLIHLELFLKEDLNSA